MTDATGDRLFSLSGEVDIATSAQAEGELTRFADESPAQVIRVDCSNLEFIDSSGLQVVVRVDRKLRERGRKLQLVQISSQLRRLLEITQLERLTDEASCTPSD